MQEILQRNCTQRGCRNCVLRSPIFDHLNEEELEVIDKNRFDLRFKPGEIIRKQGAYLSHVIFVTDGLASLYIEGLNDRNLILKMVKPNNFIGGPGMFVDHRHHYTVKSHTGTEACFIEVETFKAVLHSNAHFAEEFFKDFSRNILNTYSRLVNLTQRYVPGRMADALIYLSEEIFESHRFDPVLSSKELAALAGMSTDSVLKTLREYRSNDIIRQSGKTMEIINFEALRRISETG